MFRPEVRILTDDEIEEIRRGVEGGTRGPVLLKWIELLLADHDARVAAGQKTGKE